MQLRNNETPLVAAAGVSNLSNTFGVIDMSSIAIAASTINVPFHGANLYVVNHNGEPYTPMKPIVEGMGMAWQTQHRKLTERFSKGITEMVIPSAGGSQSMTCLGNYGTGGAGQFNNISQTQKVGGNGANGYLIIWEYSA
ncbi:phage antirepressor N-terminal domain-containing protein [Yersinia enterocolitica]